MTRKCFIILRSKTILTCLLTVLGLTLGALLPVRAQIAANRSSYVAGRRTVQLPVFAANLQTFVDAAAIERSILSTGRALSPLAVAPPTLTKSFGNLSVAAGAVTTVRFNIGNPNGSALTNVTFGDLFPTGMTTAGGGSSSCPGVQFSDLSPGRGNISIGIPTLAATTACVVTINIKATVPGTNTNVSTTIISEESSPGTAGTASILVIANPTISKTFGTPSILVNGKTSLTVTVTNPNAAQSLSGVAFTDNFPSGLIVDTPNGLSTTCSGPVVATAGSGILSMSNSTLASSASCTVSVNVQGTTASVINNVTDPVTSIEGGTGNAASASLAVVGSPTIAKAFGATSIPLNSSTSLTFTIFNPNLTTALTNIGFSDALLSGLQVAATPNLATTCVAGTTITGATAGSTNISNIAIPSLAAASFCTVSLDVTGTTAGTKNNTTSAVTATETGTGATSNTATLTVVAPPTIAKAFGAATIPLNGTTSLTFTLTNPFANTVAEAGVAFTDSLTTGLVVATPNGLSNTCGGTATATAGSGLITLTGGAIPVNSTCTLSVNITGTVAGNYTNTTGAVSSTNGGTGAVSNTVPLAVLSADLSITKTDGVASAPAGSTVTYTIVASNAGPSNVIGATVVDSFPAAIINAQWTCVVSAGSSCGALAGTGNINQAVNILVGGTVTYTVAATISPSATGTLTNTATVAVPAGGFDPNLANNTFTDNDTLTPPSVFVIDDAVTKFEGQSGTTPFVFTVSKIGGTGFATAVQYQTFDGSATVADGDYQAQGGTLNFGPLETSKQITVLVNGDTKIEPNENFYVRLAANPVNALIGDNEGQGVIQNDDVPPTPTPVPTPTPTPPNRFEGDINRTAIGVPGTGDKDVNVADQLQYLRYLNGADCPSLNEQPRLDAGPRASLTNPNVLVFGDGLFGGTDGTAIDAYSRHDALTDFDPNTPNWQATPVSGQFNTITNLTCTVPPDGPDADMSQNVTAEPASAASARIVRVVSRPARPGSDITVDIEMEAQGNEAGTQYGLHFDPTVLSISDISGVNTNPDIMLGAGAPEGTTLNVNAADAANGNIGIVENFSSAVITALPEGTTRIARVKFHVLDSAAAGTSRVDFDTSVINGVTSDVNGMVLSANYEGGDVSVTASRGVSVSGQVTTSDGRGLRGAMVTIIGRNGVAQTIMTSAFGYYIFDGVITGERYTISIASRQYRFATRAVDVNDNLADVNFTGSE